MSESVTVHSDTADGIQTITITQTSPSTAHIALVPAGVAGSEDVKSVQADPASLTLVCQLDAFLSTADISVAVQRANVGERPIATITISHALFGNGIHRYPLRPGEDASVETFLQNAAFPPLASA